jgi:hypothetical protein
MKTKCRAPQIFGLVLLCLSMATVLNAQSKKYEVLLGTWDVQTEDGAYTFTFEFTMKDDALAGKFTGSSGEVEMTDLSFEDNTLKFSVDVNGMVIDFSATIEGESLEGMLSLEYGEANITGTKRKK